MAEGSHRRGASTTALTVVVLTAALVGVGAAGWGIGQTTEGAGAPSAGATVTVTPRPVERTVAPKPLAAARRTKPLADMTGGERVLYAEAEQKQRLCHWVAWGGVVDWSVIDCGDGQMTVKTGFLTPVERR